MFGVSAPELLTIAVVALVVVGPRRLPELARRAGELIGDLRRAAESVRRDFDAGGEVPDDGLGEARRRLATPPGDPEAGPR